jgi:YggT family protein
VRPAYILTDWIVAPIRRVVPPLGAVDLSPLVAMMVLSILRQILLSMLRG